MDKNDIIQAYEEAERRGILNKLPQEKQEAWAEYKRRQGKKDKKTKEKSTWERIDPDKMWEGAVGVASNLDEGAFFGLGKRAASAAMAAGEYPVDRFAQFLGVKNTPTFEDRYNQHVDYIDNARKNLNSSAPISGGYTEALATFRNPLYKKGANIIGKAGKILDEKNISAAKKLGGKMITGGVTNTALAEADDALRGRESGDETLAYGAVGALTPAIAQGASYALKNAGNIFSTVRKAGQLVDKTQSDKKIAELVNKYGEGNNNLETIGSVARPIVKQAQTRIEEAEKKLYNRALRLTNMRAEASLENTYRAIAKNIPDLSVETQDALVDYVNRELRHGRITKGKWVFGNPINVNQLNNSRSKFMGKIPFADTEKHAEAEIYNALKADLMENVKKHARGNMGDEAVSRLNTAFDFHKERIQPRGVSKLLSEMAKDNKSESEIGNGILNILSNKKLDSKKLAEFERALGRAGSDGAPLKKAIIANIRNESQFNNLSKKGKEFVYGDALPEAEKAFNGSFGKKAGAKLSALADVLDSKTPTPYLLGMIRLLFNNIREK